MDLSFVDRNGSHEDTGSGEGGEVWQIKITANTIFFRLNAFRTGQNKRV